MTTLQKVRAIALAFIPLYVFGGLLVLYAVLS